jgi:hypothetical protein
MIPLPLRRWDEFRKLFTDDLQCLVDDGRIMGTDASRPAFTSREEFVQNLIDTDDKRWSVHHGRMPEIEFLDADSATGVWAMFGWGEYPTRNLNQVYGHYHDVYRRCDDDRWRIAVTRLVRLRHAYLTPQPTGRPRYEDRDTRGAGPGDR